MKDGVYWGVITQSFELTGTLAGIVGEKYVTRTYESMLEVEAPGLYSEAYDELKMKGLDAAKSAFMRQHNVEMRIIGSHVIHHSIQPQQ